MLAFSNNARSLAHHNGRPLPGAFCAVSLFPELVPSVSSVGTASSSLRAAEFSHAAPRWSIAPSDQPPDGATSEFHMPSAPRDSGPSPAASDAARAARGSARRGRLAISLQEPLTTVARLRANKQVAADGESFRTRIKQVLASSEQDARALGYSSDDVRYALFAVIAFLDETVLNSGQAMFANWAGRTLQQEVFGVHMAGELFFQYLESLLARQDSADLADVLEVFDLCLLMGFKGRYSGTHGGDVQVLSRQIAEKIDRIRGGTAPLAPRWKPTSADIGRRRDPWVRRLGIIAAATVIVAVGLFAYYSVSLSSGRNELQAQATQLSR